jgi:uncharacterized protein (TIGR03437 family)
MKRVIALFFCGAMLVAKAAGPTVTAGTLSFTYEVNSSTFPAAQKVTATLPAAISTLPMTVATASTPPGWLTVTPSTGHSPLAMTVTVNPTSLTPGSFSGTITIDSQPTSGTPAVISVTLSVTNPPSRLLASGLNAPNYTPAASGATSAVLTFTYTTGSPAAAPAQSQLDVGSNGDIIPFNVTAANVTVKGAAGGGKTDVWLRVNGSGQLPNLTTSGVALSGSSVPIFVTLDFPTVSVLDPGSYVGQITIAATNAVNGSTTVLVNLVVSAGPPKLDPALPVFPASVIAGPLVDPVLTIYGDNFFSTSVVSIQQGANPSISLGYGKSDLPLLLSRKVLQVSIKAAYLAAFPVRWTLSVDNPAPANNPSQPAVTAFFDVTDPTQPAITSVMNAASYLATARQSGTELNPVGLNQTSVAPREIVSIFGKNLGSAAVTATTPSGTPSLYPLISPDGIQVKFTYGVALAKTITAPIIFTSSNQINCVVPKEVSESIGQAAPNAFVQVLNGPTATLAFPLTVVAEDPGVFSFAGLGQGQGAILNYDSASGSFVINSAKSQAPRGSTVSIYVTGMGELSTATVGSGEVASAAIPVADNTVRVDIDGQPAVVTYAGTTPGAVAGLVQVNAIIPPTVRALAAIPLTVSIGSAATARQSQANVTIAVK